MTRPFKVAVVGGAGAMGRITVRDLVETAPVGTEVVVADYNLAAAKALTRSLSSKRVRLTAVKVDATDVAGSARVLAGAFAVVNAVQHHYNLFVMEAALRARAHYTDLGGLFHMTQKQLPLSARFKKIDRLAVLGMGAAPGVTNLLARAAADEMDEVHEVHIAVAGVDRTKGREPSLLGTSYSLSTVLDEATLPAAFFTRGKMSFVDPLSHAQRIRFPAPVGERAPACTIHSEVATLPQSYRKKKIRECSFRIAFGDDLMERLRFLSALGMTRSEPITVGNQPVVPRKLLLDLVARLPAGKPGGTPDEYEILRATVKGRIGKTKVSEIVDCHVPGIRRWRLGVDVDTGCPPSIWVQMLARGELLERGVLPPERAVPYAPFFRELKRRNMTVRRNRTKGAGHE